MWKVDGDLRKGRPGRPGKKGKEKKGKETPSGRR
jgi:hypothetical protein